MNQSMIELAIKLASEYHLGQVDKGGNPYILHPLAVMNRVGKSEEKVVAVLHDILEDTTMTVTELLKHFPREIVEAVEALTRRPEETYREFILRVKENTLARVVKIADMEENMDLSRIPNPTQVDYERVENRYKKFIVLLKEEEGFIREEP
ncbi:GTP pyrophosphokinase (plasmid) [Rossellomorea sp. AcN35-11]|nr:GTP pyrophosphokinase [Rossellomorea aquimaris]WJV32424.1 GTP pyrophosphokinase [Rossellomorea sp. AcN35-11]